MHDQWDTLKPAGALQSLFVVLLAIALLALSVHFFDEAAAYGPVQSALIIATVVAAGVGIFNGLSWQDIESSIGNGIRSSSMGLLVMLSVGGLLGIWSLSGTIPSLIYYGLAVVEFGDGAFAYVIACVICAIVGFAIGSAWTTLGTLGLTFIGIAFSAELSVLMMAGAIISGAYFGDKMSLLSDTTTLSAATTGADVLSHVRHMLWTSVPAFVVTLCLYFYFGIEHSATFDTYGIDSLRQTLDSIYIIDVWLLAPFVFLIVCMAIRIPALVAIVATILISIAFAVLFQIDLIASMQWESDIQALFVDVIWSAVFNGIELSYLVPDDDAMHSLLTRGGITSMATPVTLVITVVAFICVLKVTGIIQTLYQRILTALDYSQTVGSLLLKSILTGIGINLVVSDQYTAIVLTGALHHDEFEENELAPENLSRAVEDSVTVTSPLIPWNTCGIYIGAILAINPLDYLFYAFFNMLSPIFGALVGPLRVKFNG